MAPMKFTQRFIWTPTLQDVKLLSEKPEIFVNGENTEKKKLHHRRIFMIKISKCLSKIKEKFCEEFF